MYKAVDDDKRQCAVRNAVGTGRAGAVQFLSITTATSLAQYAYTYTQHTVIDPYIRSGGCHESNRGV
jgi:hypothetical protein